MSLVRSPKGGTPHQGLGGSDSAAPPSLGQHAGHDKAGGGRSLWLGCLDHEGGGGELVATPAVEQGRKEGPSGARSTLTG